MFSFPPFNCHSNRNCQDTVKKSNTWIETSAMKIRPKFFPYLRHSSLHTCFSTCPFSSNLAAPDTPAVVLSYGFLSSLNYRVVWKWHTTLINFSLCSCCVSKSNIRYWYLYFAHCFSRFDFRTLRSPIGHVQTWKQEVTTAFSAFKETIYLPPLEPAVSL